MTQKVRPPRASRGHRRRLLRSISRRRPAFSLRTDRQARPGQARSPCPPTTTNRKSIVADGTSARRACASVRRSTAGSTTRPFAANEMLRSLKTQTALVVAAIWCPLMGLARADAAVSVRRAVDALTRHSEHYIRVLVITQRDTTLIFGSKIVTKTLSGSFSVSPRVCISYTTTIGCRKCRTGICRTGKCRTTEIRTVALVLLSALQQSPHSGKYP